MVYDSVYKLADEIKASPEYKSYIEARDKVMSNETNATLLKEYQKLSFQAQPYLMAGKEVPAETAEKLQKLYSVLQLSQECMDYLMKEYQFSATMNEVYSILSKAIDLNMGLPTVDEDNKEN